MSSAEWRTGASVLAWCRTTLVVAGAVTAQGCTHWVQGVDLPVVEGPGTKPIAAKGSALDRQECDRFCAKAYGSTGTCHLATLAIEPATNIQAGAPALRSGSSVIVCETDSSSHWEATTLSPFMQFGRRPPEASDRSFAPAPTSAREHFERAATDEARAVLAFQQLVLDLEQLAAPPYLISSAKRAAADEARHVRWTLEMAQTFGGSTRATRARPPRPSSRKISAFDLALENATVGCIGETLGTWLQVFQARAAQQSSVRATAQRIAKDEARHAALAFRLFDWLDARLGPTERECVRAAMLLEAQRLDGRSTLPQEIATQIGLPDAWQVARVARALHESLSLVCPG